MNICSCWDQILINMFLLENVVLKVMHMVMWLYPGQKT